MKTSSTNPTLDFFRDRKKQLKEEIEVLKKDLAAVMQAEKSYVSGLGSIDTSQTKMGVLKSTIVLVIRQANQRMRAGEILEKVRIHLNNPEIQRTSLSPQLSRLAKDDGILEHEGEFWWIKSSGANLEDNDERKELESVKAGS